ncbi:MAG: MlaD family protein [Treponema sp.]|jgi:phospholipid/cholesterol/gamma-HCH transport system substrate-binding protein|nr:MlaD family protein [Treponema sp.]
MKFSIRFADQIVGFFVILALAILVFVVIMLGKSQRWFSRDSQYRTYFTSAAGLSPNMAIQYKGFTIGNVKTIQLSGDDKVEVFFTIFEEHHHRVREGSLVEVQSSPLGSSFIFHPGIGTELVPEWEVIPEVNTPEARQLIAAGLAIRADSSDSIGNAINQANNLLTSLNDTLAMVNEALSGSDQSSLGRTLGNVEKTTENITDLTQTLSDDIGEVLARITPILEDVGKITDKASGPSSMVMSALETDGPVYQNIVSVLDSVSGIIKNLEKTTDFVPAQLPQIAVLLSDLHGALTKAEELMTALTNNPLLRGGVPVRMETGPGAANPRNLEF